MGIVCGISLCHSKKRTEALLASAKDASKASFAVEQTAPASQATAVEASIPAPTYSSDIAPVNLPIEKEEAPQVIGYAAREVDEMIEEVKEVTTETKAMHMLEQHAHEHRALISSDALRVIVRDLPTEGERITKLDELIAEAKAAYPSEDGWIVLNLERLEALLKAETSAVLDVDNATVGVGSLAEAIALGDLEAAYVLIGRRPMLALADAAADFDALYRMRQGGDEQVSSLLVSTLGNRSDEEVVAVVKTLTSALDGTYTTEVDAVKVAIMKAVRLLS